jgi:TetR/AcrR family tetracycline transcriptional repressor
VTTDESGSTAVRGRKLVETLSRDAVIERAMDLADAEGLDAVTIRRLAQQFGVTPMALYWHVKNKDELLDAMGDRLFASVVLDVDVDVEWDEQLRAVIEAFVAAFRAHPTCLDLVYRRILASPRGQHLTEYTLGLLRRAGFSRRETADIATHALQTALMLVGAEPGAEPGVSAEEQSAKRDAKRAGLAVLPADQFPYIHEMADEMLQCDDIDAYYAFGADVFVAGARARLAASRDRAQSGS